MGTSLKRLGEAVPTSTQIVCIRAKYENQWHSRKPIFSSWKCGLRVYTHTVHRIYMYVVLLVRMSVYLSFTTRIRSISWKHTVSHNTLLKQNGTCQAIACKFFEEFYSDDIIRIIVPAQNFKSCKAQWNDAWIFFELFPFDFFHCNFASITSNSFKRFIIKHRNNMFKVKISTLIWE